MDKFTYFCMLMCMVRGELKIVLTSKGGLAENVWEPLVWTVLSDVPYYYKEQL